MTRKFEIGVGGTVRDDLDGLLGSGVPEYQGHMYRLGRGLGERVAATLAPHSGGMVACTVEDADYLARGIVDALTGAGHDVSVACYWNNRIKGSLPELDSAPILRRYLEPTESKLDYLVVAKSIIAGGCVVRTNLSDLIDVRDPKRIFIAAPVMRSGAREELRNDFASSLAERFEFIWFAEDDEEREGIVLPGVGGNVYERLGLGSQDEKNAVTPQLVITRRNRIAA